MQRFAYLAEIWVHLSLNQHHIETFWKCIYLPWFSTSVTVATNTGTGSWLDSQDNMWHVMWYNMWLTVANKRNFGKYISSWTLFAVSVRNWKKNIGYLNARNLFLTLKP